MITVDKAKKNLNLLKDVREILRFQISIQDFKNPSKSIQCFRCQNFGHKAEFCNLKNRCVKFDGNHNTRACVKAAGTPPKCTNCGGEHPANYRGCPTAKQYEERRGVTRAPSRPQAPRINSVKEFPPLPGRPQAQTAANVPPASTTETMGDLKDVIQWITTGSLSKYLKKFKVLMANVMSQNDKASKLLTLGLGIMDLLYEED